MDSGGSTTDKLFRTLERFRQSWPKQGWSWDSRFTCVASSFHVDLTGEAESSLLSTFTEEYDHRTLSKAPDYLQELAESVGGIRSDQRIFTVRTGGRLNPYAMWWPWGDEITISARIGLLGYTRDQDFERRQEEFNAR